MDAALIWKEWHQQRSLVLAAVAAALTLPLFIIAGSAGSLQTDSLTQLLPALQVIVLLPIFAAATGALCFSGDRMESNLDFLLSRPMSRRRVWAIKVGVALATFVAIVVLTLSIGALIGALANGPTLEQLAPRDYPPGMRPIGGGGLRTFIINATSASFGMSPVAAFLSYVLSGPGFLMVLFGTSVFWSTRCKRPLHALFAGIATALMAVAAQTAFSLDLSTGSFRVYPLLSLFVSAAFLLASWQSFRQMEPPAD